MGLYLDTYELISFNILGMILDMTKLFIVIPVWMTLTFTHGLLVTRKLEVVYYI